MSEMGRGERGVRGFVRATVIITFFFTSGWIAPALEARYNGQLPGLAIRREARSSARTVVNDGRLSWTMLARPTVESTPNPYVPGGPAGRSYAVVEDPITETVTVWDVPGGPIDPLVVMRLLSGVNLEEDTSGLHPLTVDGDRGLSYGFQTGWDTPQSRWTYAVALTHRDKGSTRLVVFTISTFNLPPSRYDEDKARDDKRGREYSTILESYRA